MQRCHFVVPHTTKLQPLFPSRTRRGFVVNVSVVDLQRSVLSLASESDHVVLPVIPLPVGRGRRVERVRVYAHVVSGTNSAIYLSATQHPTEALVRLDTIVSNTQSLTLDHRGRRGIFLELTLG